MNQYRIKALAVGLLATILLGCMSPEGGTSAAKRAEASRMRSDTLAQLYRDAPFAKEQIGKAVGYAVFSNVGINLILLSAGNGWGVARDNKTGKDVYMKMVSAGLGLGLGVKDFRGVFVFTNHDAFDNFVNHGWDASAQADAAAKSGKKGDAFAGAIDVGPGIKLYQITEHGLALQATIQGTKYWKDDDLNS
jgi:lipid-binding SYLF domain-containing protein